MVGAFHKHQKRCTVLELAKFYANCVVTNGVVTNTVNGHKLHFDASDLGELLGVSVVGFHVYVHED